MKDRLIFLCCKSTILYEEDAATITDIVLKQYFTNTPDTQFDTKDLLDKEGQ